MFGQWISVDEMLPDLDEKVLVTKTHEVLTGSD